MMKEQFQFPVSNVVILGIAGGNGLEHIQTEKFKKVYGIDINQHYGKALIQMDFIDKKINLKNQI